MSDNNATAKKKWYKRWWAFVLYFFIFIIIIAINSDDGGETQNQNQVVDTQPSVQEEVTEDNQQNNEVVEVQQPVVNNQQQAEVTKTETVVQEQLKEEVKPQPQEKSYQQVFTFSGNGAKKSEPFTITGSRFKIKYTCNGDLCQAFLNNTANEYDLDIIMNTTGSISDETIIYGSGEYYIEANTIGNFSMVVEDYR